MKLVIEIELGNEGVQDYHDIAYKLETLGEGLKEMYRDDREPRTTDGNVICDADGETVGAWSIIEPRYTITPNEAKCPPFEVNDAQYKALQRKHKQNADGAANFAEFSGRARWGFDGVLMLPWCGMWLGIETDGYTHS